MTWDKVPIGAVINSTQYGLSLLADPAGNLPIVGMKDIQDGRVHVDPSVSVRLSDEEAKAYLLLDGDILLNRTNSPDLVGKAGIYRGADKAVFASYLVRLELNRELADPDFVIQILNSDLGQRRIKKLATRAVSQANLNPTTFKNHFHIPLPKIREQKAIRDVLLMWDTAIEKTERLIEATERHYIDELSHLITRAHHTRSHISTFAHEVSDRNRANGCERVLSVTNTRGFVLPEDQFERRVASDDLSNYKLVRKGQYAYNPSRINVGSIARLDQWEEGALSPMYVVFRLDEGKVNSDYFLQWLSSHEARGRIKRSAQGSVRETVGFGELCAISIPLPALQTQEKIALALNSMVREIELLQQLSDAYRKQKRGLMQKLLTGEWRVKPSGEVS